MQDSTQDIDIPSEIPQELHFIWSELTLNQRKFAVEYPIDTNATRAAQRAGYSKKGCSVRGHELIHNTRVKAIIDALMVQKVRASKADADWFIAECKINYDRCMQAIPVTDTKNRVVAGMWKYDTAAAARFLEMIGKAHSIFKGGSASDEPNSAPSGVDQEHYSNHPPPAKDIKEWVKQMKSLGYDTEESIEDLNDIRLA